MTKENENTTEHENKDNNLGTLIETVKIFIIKEWVKTHSNQRFLVGGFETEFFRKVKLVDN